jgi:hypothetical protein
MPSRSPFLGAKSGNITREGDMPKHDPSLLFLSETSKHSGTHSSGMSETYNRKDGEKTYHFEPNPNAERVAEIKEELAKTKERLAEVERQNASQSGHGLRNLLQKEFLNLLSKNNPFFLSEDVWNERLQKTIDDRRKYIKEHPKRQIELEHVNQPYADYYDEINRAYFDLPTMVKLLEKCYGMEGKIDEENLRDTLESYILKKRSDRYPLPAFYPRDHREFLEHLVNAFIKAIKRVRWQEQTSGSKTISSHKAVERKKPGPKGSRPDVVKRRTYVMALYDRGIKGRKACHELYKNKIELPTPKLQVKYRGNWLLWYEEKPDAVYRQLADDRKRTPKPQKA